MPTLTVDAKALTGESVDTLANEPWTLVGHPLATASGSTVLLGSLVRKGELDDNGMAVIEDVPESPDNSWLTFRMAGIGTVVGFQMPSTDVTLGEAYAAFGEYPGPVGPTPGPPGETGPPGPQGERGLRGLGAPFQVFVYMAQ
ncbi:MAG: hypothetical protein OXQ29_18080, partial [Rhodospirillaceae bacterium]|nr:hypothetical protein [Rhodospirillaceae bacterium]